MTQDARDRLTGQPAAREGVEAIRQRVADIDGRLAKFPEVGAYNQKI